VSREEDSGLRQKDNKKKGYLKRQSIGERKKKEDAENSSCALFLPTLYRLREGKSWRGIRSGS
jgi:hypothetical protein